MGMGNSDGKMTKAQDIFTDKFTERIKAIKRTRDKKLKEEKAKRLNKEKQRLKERKRLISFLNDLRNQPAVQIAISDFYDSKGMEVYAFNVPVPKTVPHFLNIYLPQKRLARLYFTETGMSLNVGAVEERIDINFSNGIRSYIYEQVGNWQDKIYLDIAEVVKDEEKFRERVKKNIESKLNEIIKRT